tara:strand:- start:2797 stop:3198 length:402 start_codon:yes stop_codon:yes gene_type:complete
MEVKVLEGGFMPSRGSVGSAGLDLKATQDYQLVNCLQKIPIKIKLAIPKDHYGHICCRSSLAKKGCSIEAGIIDQDYRGEIQVMLRVREPLTIKKGDRVAQLIIKPYYHTELVKVDELDQTSRGDGGFGSTGI